MSQRDIDELRAVIEAGAPIIAQNAAELATHAARSNGKRPAFVKLRVADADVKALKGSADRRASELFLVRVDSRILAEIRRRKESRLVLPGEVVRP